MYTILYLIIFKRSVNLSGILTLEKFFAMFNCKKGKSFINNQVDKKEGWNIASNNQYMLRVFGVTSNRCSSQN